LGKRLREKNLSFVLTQSHNHGGFRIRSVAQGSAPCYQPWVVLSVLGVTTGLARWVLGLTPRIEPARTCRTDRAGSFGHSLTSEGRGAGWPCAPS
ncbi:hypothetical protein IQ25_02819, partial [Novosphingobium taihuense]